MSRGAKRPAPALALALALCAGWPMAASAGGTVVAVNGPLAAMAAAIGGDAVTVRYPVPEGADPALWRPGIAEISEIQAAELILLNGAGFAAWTAKTSLPRARTLVTSKGFEDAFIAADAGLTHSHGAEGEHSHMGVAPLVWLDLSQAAQQAQAVTERLARLAPEDAAGIEARGAAQVAALQALHARAEGLGARLAGRAVLADHPGYEYFARAYGLQLAALDWPPGSVPDAAALARLGAAVAERGPVLFLFQDTPSPEAAAAVAVQGLVAAVVDPGTDDPSDFVALMTANLDALEAALDALR